MNTSGVQDKEELVNTSRQKLKKKRVEIKEYKNMNASEVQDYEEMVNPSRQKLKKKRVEFKEYTNMNASEVRDYEEMVSPSRQKLKPKRVENKEQRNVNARVSQNNEGRVNLRHQNLKQKVGENKVSDGVQGSLMEPGIPRGKSQMVSDGVQGSLMEPGIPRGKSQMEQRKMDAMGSQNNEGMDNLLQKILKQKISDHTMKRKKSSRVQYSGSGPGKGVFKRPDPSNNHDLQPIRKERDYLRFQDQESVIHEDNVTMDNQNQEDHQELGNEVNSPQTNIDTGDHQENIGSNSNGTTVTRKETRALSANRKSRLNQRKLVFEVDDCAGRVVGDDSQIFITKGGCVVRECAVFDGKTWKKQPQLLIEDIISKTTEHSDFKPTCPIMARAIKTQLATHHRTRQYQLHKHYLKFPTQEEATTHPPDGVKVAEWVLLCERFGSEKFQKISTINKQNRACNQVPPTVGTKSVARRMHAKRIKGKEVTAIGGYKIAHWSKKKKAMINEKAAKIWSELRDEEASSSSTPAEICIKKLGHIPGHVRGRAASTKHVFETESLRMDLNSEKEKAKQLEKDLLALKEDHLKLQKKHVSLTKKVNYLLKNFTAWNSLESEGDDYEDYDEGGEDYDESGEDYDEAGEDYFEARDD